MDDKKVKKKWQNESTGMTPIEFTLQELKLQKEEFEIIVRKLYNNMEHPYICEIEKTEGYFYGIKQVLKEIDKL